MRLITAIILTVVFFAVPMLSTPQKILLSLEPVELGRFFGYCVHYWFTFFSKATSELGITAREYIIFLLGIALAAICIAKSLRRNNGY